MTREEALKILPDMKGAGEDWDKAIEIAIKALEQAEPCNELVSIKFREIGEAVNAGLAEGIKNVPDTNVGKIDRYGYISIETLLNFCENSKDHAITPNDFMRMKRVRMPEPCEDAVSRKAVYDLLLKKDCDWTFSQGLLKLPPVTPKPKMGRWIYEEHKRLTDETDDGPVYMIDRWWKCSTCGHDYGYREPDHQYCKYCGSMNRGEQE